MESIKISDKRIRLAINDDETKVIAFDPNDIGFINRYYGLIDFLSENEKKYANEAECIDKSEISESEKRRKGFQLLRKMCVETKEQFDIVFGEGTMDRIFGECLRLDMFQELLYGIAPYINEVRQEKINKYSGSNSTGVMH